MSVKKVNYHYVTPILFVTCRHLLYDNACVRFGALTSRAQVSVLVTLTGRFANLIDT